jgi:hypothetical protein
MQDASLEPSFDIVNGGAAKASASAFATNPNANETTYPLLGSDSEHAKNDYNYDDDKRRKKQRKRKKQHKKKCKRRHRRRSVTVTRMTTVNRKRARQAAKGAEEKAKHSRRKDDPAIGKKTRNKLKGSLLECHWDQQTIVTTARTTKTKTIPIVANNKLEGDTNVDVRIERTNDRGASFAMTFRPRGTALRLERDGRIVADWPRAKARATRHTSVQTRGGWGCRNERGMSEYLMLKIEPSFGFECTSAAMRTFLGRLNQPRRRSV